MKKVLIIAMPNSIHTFRWIHQIKDENFKIYLLPCVDGPINSNYDTSIKIVGSSYMFFNLKLNKYRAIHYLTLLFLKIKKQFSPNYFQKRLAKIIEEIRPNLVHTIETQHSGYLLLNSLNYRVKDFVWWHTNWGSDILIFSKLDNHDKIISTLLKTIDIYSCECYRDIILANSLGYSKQVLPVYPNAGGFSIHSISELRSKTLKTSERKCIMLKGYQGWAGRALVGLRALERCVDILQGYKIFIFSNTSTEDIIIASGLFTKNNGIEVILIPENTPHFKILEFQGQSRLYIGLSIGDGISTSLLESMAMGSFPIQSCTSCADEWFEDGKSGFIVPPEDPDVIEYAIRKALRDDELVDFSAIHNFETIKNKADYHNLKFTTIRLYNDILNQNKYEFTI